LKSHILTIVIPTFNRSQRLAKNLECAHGEICRSNLENKIGILISDNNSSDDTQVISRMYGEKFINSGIDFEYFQNQSNLGFSSNVIESYFRAKSEYSLFFSDDDNLNAGFLQQLISDINQYKFSAGIYNFIQPPYGEDNLLIKESRLFVGEQAIGDLASLVKWPKLSGLVLRNIRKPGRYEKIKNQITPNNVVGHVLLTIDQIRHDPILFKSSTVAAYPDQDFRDHVNFVSYIGNYIKRDVGEYCARVGIENSYLMSAIEEIPSRNVVLCSLQTLSLFYKSQTKLSQKMKQEVFRNIFSYLIGSHLSDKGLFLERPYRSIPRIKTLFYLFYLAGLALKARISRKKLYLMNEAF